MVQAVIGIWNGRARADLECDLTPRFRRVRVFARWLRLRRRRRLGGALDFADARVLRDVGARKRIPNNDNWLADMVRAGGYR